MEKEFTRPLGPPPRKARFRRNIRNLRRAYRTLFVLVIVVFGGWALVDGLHLYELTFRTATAVGKITHKEAAPRTALEGTTGVRDSRLEYAFTTPDGTLETGTTAVSAEIFDNVQEGGPCTVVYLPAHPAEHWLNDNFAARGNSSFLMISFATAAIVALIVLFVIDRPLRRELTLARRGQVAQGMITATGRGRRRRSRAWIAYSFATPTGATVQGRCVIPRSATAEVREPGTVTEILFDPRHPEINKARLGLDFVEFA